MLLRVLIVSFLIAIPLAAEKTQQSGIPFYELLAALRAHGGGSESRGWWINREENARLFQLERIRLNKDFTREVLAFVAENPDRHYNVAIFLSSPECLGTQPPDYFLALLIFDQGIRILENHPDPELRNSAAAFRVLAAILAWKVGLKALATSHKANAERLDRLMDFFPAMEKEQLAIYNNIDPVSHH